MFCTHLHIDHTGWNTTLRDGRWVPTFPNAKYVFHKGEYAAWEAEHARGANPPGTVFRDNCLPIVEAGQALLVDDDYALDDTITLTPTPGHSPCHCCVNIRSRGQRAVVTGDMMPHAIQCRELDWSPGVDWDPKEAAVSRRRFLSVGRGHRYTATADPFPIADCGVGDGRWRSLPLPIQAGVAAQEPPGRGCRAVSVSLEPHLLQSFAEWAAELTVTAVPNHYNWQRRRHCLQHLITAVRAE